MKSKKFFKRLTALATSAVMIASCVTTTSLFVSAASSNFDLGNMSCVLSDDGTLTVSGSGNMSTVGASARPWKKGECSVDDIKSIIVSEGITSVKNFSNLTNLTHVELAESVTFIDSQAFNGCSNPELVIDIKGKITQVNSLKPFGDVVGTIYVYDSDTFNIVSKNATTAKVELKANTDNLKRDLQKVVDETKENYPAWYYTEESYKELEELITDAEGVIAKSNATVEDISAASDALKYEKNSVLFNSLVSKIQAAIDEANGLGTSAYTASTADALAEAIQKAQEVSDKGAKTDANANGADQAEVTAAIEAITTAKAGLKEKASNEKVNAFEAHYRNAVKSSDENGYTPESWALYAPVIEEYETLYSVRRTDATDEQIDAVMKSLDEAAAQLVKDLKLDEYKAAKKAIEDILEARDPKYTDSTFDSLQSLYNANTQYEDENGEIRKGIEQSTIDALTRNMKNALDPKSEGYRLVLKGDVNNLAALVDGCKDLIESDYTSDSWKTFTTAKDAAEALVNDPDNAGVDAIAAAEEALKKAIDTIVINYSNSTGDEVPPIGYIQKNGATLVMDKGTANDELAGTATVRIVFDCAADVSFNPYAAIEIKAVVAGVESYEKFAGTDGTETSGTKNWIVELALTNPIASGNSYEISGFTYAWNNASDYVYAITKVEYLDAEGNVLKTVSKANDTEKLDDFNEAVENAKSLIASDKYTEDSIKALEEAVAKADALLTDSNGKPLPSKMSVIEEEIAKAIEGLVELPKGNISGTVVTPNANAEVTVTVATADGTEVTKATSANGEYTVSDLEDGEYVITFAAEGYVTRSYKATVAGSDITLEAEIHIVGDVNGDGTITTVDVGLANAHVKQTKTLEEYDFEVAEVSGDDMITTVDVGIINSTAKGA